MRSSAAPSLLVLLGSLAIGCGSSAPILLRPALPNARVACPLGAYKVRLASVVDRRGYADKANVGFTQTGWTNVQASLRTQPTPRELVKQRLENLLSGCKGSPDAPELQLEVLVTRFQTTETTTMVSESIQAEIALEVRLKAASGEALGMFDLSASAEEGGIDTTDSAVVVIEKALAGVESKLASSLAARSASLPSGQVVSVASAATPSLPMARRVAVKGRPMTADEEDDKFDDRLKRAGLTAIQVEIRVTQRGAPISIRRDGILLSFSDGTSTRAVDTRKVQEMARTSSGAGVGAAFGVTGAIVASAAVGADAAAAKEIGEAGLDVAVLKNVGAKIAGLIFFSQAPGPQNVPTELSLELIDARGATESLVVPIARAPLRVAQAR